MVSRKIRDKTNGVRRRCRRTMCGRKRYRRRRWDILEAMLMGSCR